MAERTVHISEKGMRLDRFVRIHFPDLPFGLLSSVLKRGRLTVDGRRARATDRLAAGQVVALAERDGEDGSARRGEDRRGRAMPAIEPPSAEERAFLAGITLYEDDDLMVFDKPSGLPVHAGTRTDGDLDSLLARMVDARGERPVLVHRLDKDTSGVLVAAKSRAIAGVLGKAFSTRAVEKSYLAVVSGVPERREGLIEIALRKIETPRGGRMSAAGAGEAGALAAATDYRVVEGRHGIAIMSLKPLTGRQHQLRAHMALIGHPILGDRLYGGAAGPRLMLHAARIAFRHPRGGDVVFEAAPGPDWDAALIAFERSPPRLGAAGPG